MSTEHTRERLATRPITTVKSAPISARLAQRRRLVAFAELFADAARKPEALYALTRRDPRCALPDEKQHQLIHQGIRDGVITRERIIRYRATQLLDDLAAFPDRTPGEEALYVPFMTELAEAAEAQTIARGVPTPANCDEAVKQTRELVAIAEIRCAAIAQRGATR